MQRRKNTYRLVNFDYTREGLYFITLCCENHHCCLGNIVDETTRLTSWGEIVRDCWEAIPKHFPQIKLHEYVIMPNHLHGILEVTESENATTKSRSISSVIRGFKIGVTEGIGHSIWQRNYYDHVIRQRDSHENIVDYILNNPARWGTDKYYKIISR